MAGKIFKITLMNILSQRYQQNFIFTDVTLKHKSYHGLVKVNINKRGKAV